MNDEPKRGVFHRAFDSLANLMTGAGGSNDPRMANVWIDRYVDDSQVMAAYRSNWLMRRIVNTPAFDMTRAWRDWQGGADEIEALEAEEKRLQIREKVQHAIRLGRLGGGALILGIRNSPPANPMPETLSEGDLLYVHPVPRSKLSVGAVVTDPEDADFGQPASFGLRSPGGEDVPVHRDKVIIFKGEFTGGGVTGGANQSADYWGDSIIVSVNEAVTNATVAMNEFAGLIAEAKIDVFKIPDLMSLVGTPDYEARFMRRMELAQVGKSTHRALIMDAAETWEQRQIAWSGMREVIQTYLGIVAGACDIPATRLLGKSPDGMNSTGDGDQGNYDQMISSRQDADLRPAMEKLDVALIPSALGKVPDEVGFTFAPLSVLGEKDAAEVESKEAETLVKLTGTGLFQDEALEEAFSNRMIESGRWPGYEKARTDALKAAALEPDPADVPGLGITQPPAPGQPPQPTPPGATPQPGQPGAPARPARAG